MDGKSVLILLLLVSSASTAEVYKCADGKYQAEPCDAESTPLDLSNVGSVVSSPTSSNNDFSLKSSISDKKSEVSSYIRKQQIKREITDLEKDRNQVFRDRDSKIKELRERGQHANNNLAGATWQQSLAQEMTAVMQQADTVVSTIDRQIAALRSELTQ
ncbi:MULTISPECIES: hypothetical protein [Pseudomonadati]|uniref:DUF4124 domain-containing protein n=1 Tax=Shewanella aestuarii TaxID=1028752 RepID=A0ABT0L177_9GAMM|nr:hypothetical protein [Shewanella aestuarii]MCL1117476.1 hypothetical protein [Shewanella aestuarii]GGN75759.1 hypothetical protein GCM10009193_16400 [Shewanella aestuarii]